LELRPFIAETIGRGRPFFADRSNDIAYALEARIGSDKDGDF